MKVGFIAPMSIAAVNGGVRAQALNTIKHLKAFGVEPILLSPWDEIKSYNLDLIHVFGASIENAGIVDQFDAMGIPMVLSPIFYSNRSAEVIRRAIKFEKYLSFLGSGIRSDFSIKADICFKCSFIFPNTTDEAELISDGFQIPDKKIEVIPNGVEDRFAHSDPELFIEKYGMKDFVLFTGQAGAPRKNVIKLLEIAPQLEVPIVIIGSLYQDEYGNRCRELAEKAVNITLIETLPHNSDLLASAYAASKVFVLPSQYETPGIAAMEAALAGSKIVITERGGTKDYFDNYAEYINPDSASSLLNGLKKALDSASSETLKDYILDNFSWQKVAKKTANQYKRLLK